MKNLPDDAIARRARRLAAEVAALVESGHIPDSDAHEPDRVIEDASGVEADGAAADAWAGYDVGRDGRGRWA